MLLMTNLGGVNDYSQHCNNIYITKPNHVE